MTSKPRKFCAAFPCFYLAEGGSAYCHKHRPAPAPKEADPFYLSVQWRAFRDWYISRHPVCEQCEKDGRLTRATMVDHIVELKDGGAAISESNVQSLCWKCHGVKTAEAKQTRERRN